MSKLRNVYMALVLYVQGGVIVENMHDIPYVKSSLLGPETTASMTRVCAAVRNILPTNIACGVQVKNFTNNTPQLLNQQLGALYLLQILAAANKEAIAVSQASNCDFIRAEGFVFGHIADEGYIESCAGSLLRYRRQVGANRVLVFTDIKKKHR